MHFGLIGKRLSIAFSQLLKQYDPFRAKKRGQNVVFSTLMSFLLLPTWFIFYLPAAYIIRPFFYWLDYLDRQKTLTTGYTAVFIQKYEQVMKILIELPTWLGDAVMTTPAIENLSSYYDQPEITLIGSFALG